MITREVAGTSAGRLCSAAGMLGIAADWKGGIEEFVKEANRRLPGLLPADLAARLKDEVNARLIRPGVLERRRSALYYGAGTDSPLAGLQFQGQQQGPHQSWRRLGWHSGERNPALATLDRR